MKATGTFEVKVTPVPGDAAIGQLKLEKTFSGDLAARGQGIMLAAGNPAKGSAGYVAMEQVTGSLHDKQGTFILQHSGFMAGGAAEMTVSIVPGSGTGALEGLAGTMQIIIDGRTHSYVLDYNAGGA